MRGQARFLLGRLEVIGSGGTAAALRRNNALQAGKEMGEPEEGRCPEHFARAGDP